MFVLGMGDFVCYKCNLFIVMGIEDYLFVSVIIL